MTSSADHRQFTRRARSIRFRFDGAGDEQRAVATNVSPAGAFLKASWVPERGQQIVLREIVRGNTDLGVRVASQVVWTIPRPTLQNPEIGYAVQFVEAYTTGDPQPLKDFLAQVSPGLVPRLQTADREGRPASVYRFEAEAAQRGRTQREDEELHAVDLHKELARLDRAASSTSNDPLGVRERSSTRQPAAGREVSGLDYYTRARPTASVPAPAPTAAAPPSATASDSNVTARPSDPTPARPGTRPKRRGFGGLLGIFGFGKDEAEETSEAGFDDESSFSPAFGGDDSYFDKDDMYVDEETPADVLVAWKDQEAPGRVERISGTMIAVAASGNLPLNYERVVITPAFPTFKSPKVVMHGTVTRVRERQGRDGYTVIVRFSKIDEKGRSGSFAEYLRYFGA